jgi:DtxR family Mn-dependent transcriptional regulator
VSVSQLSASNQNYLKVVWALGEWNHEPVAPSALASRLGLRPSTVSDAVRKLAEQGLLEHTPYGAISLTEEGRVHALSMVRRHRLIETFLVKTLGYSWDQVHDEAEHLEHAVSDFMVERIAEILGHPTRDPHGDPIPEVDGTIHVPNAYALTEYDLDSYVRVERISDDDPKLLQYLAEQGIGIGTTLHLVAGAPYTESVAAVTSQGGSTPLGVAALSEIWASPIFESEFSDTPQ